MIFLGSILGSIFTTMRADLVWKTRKSKGDLSPPRITAMAKEVRYPMKHAPPFFKKRATRI
jgi:hypothetical protein